MDDETQGQAASLRKDRAQPKVSCLRCRDQKLKCNRELPSCMRCRKQSVDCTYPSPPDRRRIAQRVSEARALESLSHGSDQLNQRQRSTSTRNSKSTRPKPEEYVCVVVPSPCRSSDQTAESGSCKIADLPSTEVGLLLLEVYFKRVYNATLLFHKAIFFDLYRQHGVPDYLLRAIFAHAAVFLQNIESSHKDQIKIFAMPTIYERSWSWARSASREVLSSADEPTLARIQTLQVLQLYYFSRGDASRAKIHLSLSYQLGRLLEYPSLREEGPHAYPSQQSMFDREMKRRCFWAIWCSVSLGEPLSNFEGMREEVIGLPLPTKFEASGLVQGKELNLGQKMTFDWESSPVADQTMSDIYSLSSVSLMATLVKCLGAWMDVKEFISSLPGLSNAERMGRFEVLVARAESIYHNDLSNLTVSNLCSRAEVYNESPELLVSVYSIYLLCQVFLHASVGFKSESTASEPFATIEIRSRCSRLVYEYAIAYVKLLQLLFEKDLDLTRLWPLTAYGAFVVGNVLTIYRQKILQSNPGNRSLRIPGPGSAEMKVMQTILEVSSTFWKHLRIFTTKSKQTISIKQFDDMESVISYTYPWGIPYPEKTSKIPEHDRCFDDDLGIAVMQCQSPRGSISFDQPPVEGSAQHDINITKFQSTTEQHIPSYTTSYNGSSYPDIFDFEYQAGIDDVFMENVDKCFPPEANWWEAMSIER